LVVVKDIAMNQLPDLMGARLAGMESIVAENGKWRKAIWKLGSG
jgi:hypothetical protein